MKGYIAIILHAHLPFVRHPEHEGVLEEKWLFEAISETYLPLIKVFDNLTNENIDFRITMSITPPLLSMLNDSFLKDRYVKYLEKLIELTEKEIHRTRNDYDLNRLAIMYRDKYANDLHTFRDIYGKDIISAFKRFRDAGKLEIIGCGATHGYIPLMSHKKEAMNAQISVGIKSHESFLGEKPRGFWLPECGYVPQVENVLKDNGIEYIITESHGILYATPRPVYGTFAPVVTPNGIVAFGRDIESSRQVWSAHEGYPGDYDYREYYRDIGFDLDFEYIKDYISPDGKRTDTGIKYYRITGKTEEKKLYNPEWAKVKAELHAENFKLNREKQVEHWSYKIGRPPVIVCPYDAELFGHWWYEGPEWLYHLFKKLNSSYILKTVTLSEYMDENPIMQVSTPCRSSWGSRGYNEVWLNETNDWIYRHLDNAVDRMVELASENEDAEGLKKDALNQAARELLLAQSSDWAFIMKMGTMVQYAQRRTKEHIGRFTRLYDDIRGDSINEEWLRDIQYKDNIFPEIDFRKYLSKN
ncbi:MAG TPA: 1,4-alpha-glucan branching protein domain-containing protein [Clostridia bacterium]